MSKGLKIATPPRRPDAPKSTAPKKRVPTKLKHIAENDIVQFNKRVPQSTARGYKLLSATTNHSVPELLTEALEMLEEKYGKS